MKKTLLIPWDLWKKFAHALGWVNTRIILTLVFTLIIGLYAIVFKIIALLKRKPTVIAWSDKKIPTRSLSSLERQF
jgi:hypothetical protein